MLVEPKAGPKNTIRTIIEKIINIIESINVESTVWGCQKVESRASPDPPIPVDVHPIYLHLGR